jgi:hypothetical protein
MTMTMTGNKNIYLHFHVVGVDEEEGMQKDGYLSVGDVSGQTIWVFCG